MDIRFLLELKIDLLIYGVSLDGDFDLISRAFLSSISEGIHIVLEKDICVTASINQNSNYVLRKLLDAEIYLQTPDLSCLKVNLIPTGSFLGRKSTDGTYFDKIGTFQKDRLRISAYKGCNFVLKDEGCKFCEISHKRIQHKNKINNIKELVSYCEKNEKRIKHYFVSGGTPTNYGWDHFISVCETIREGTEKSIYAMFSPPPNLNTIKNIVDVGVQDIAINLELFSREKAKEFTPGKSRLGLEKYYSSLDYCVGLLGDKGNVKSVLIVGLEDYDDTLEGVENLAKRGVMPILSIFKPIPGTPLENHPIPHKDDLISIWGKAQNICEKHSLTLGPLCKCCQNNTLTLPINDNYFNYE